MDYLCTACDMKTPARKDDSDGSSSGGDGRLLGLALEEVRRLGDFTTQPRVLLISGIAIVVGAAGALAGLVLLELIRLVTNFAYFGRLTLAHLSLAATPLGAAAVAVPVIGGLLIGFMARYGTEKIRGHGIPEAIEAILLGRSRLDVKVAILKPLSSAISIGTGGPFGAEGPIIMTGGAIGSLIGQVLPVTDGERKTLLVAGAAAGMTTVFGTPIAAMMIAVELLLFEWTPRSFIPVAAAAITAAMLRPWLGLQQPLFPFHGGMDPSVAGLFCWVLIGLLSGVLSALLTRLVYACEDLFLKLPIHWMWWPAIGGLIIGVGGLFEPHALGVGYDVIDQLLTGRATMDLIVGILVVKTLIWSLSLGSGTSGGVLAPVFMIGGSLGAAEGLMFPHVMPGFWAMLGLAAVVGGVMRSPLTGVVFTLELTHAWSALLPVLVSSVAAYALSVLILKRSVLTEKIARHGHHLTREYTTDPLETFFVRDVMNPATELATALTVHADDTLRTVACRFADSGLASALVTDEVGVIGSVTVTDLLTARRHDLTEEHHRERLIVFRSPIKPNGNGRPTVTASDAKE